MDEFEQKRSMVKVLMDMLKKSAGDEVSRGHSLTHTPLPSGSVADHPHKKESYDKSHAASASMDGMKPEAGDMSTPGGMEGMGDAMPKMADGGMAMASDEPENETPADTHEAEGGEAPKVEMEEGPIEEEDEDNNSSSFAAFRKKKK